MNPQIKLFAGSGSKDLAQKIAQKFGIPLGESTTQRFSDGEIQPVYQESVRGCMVFIVQSTNPPSDNMIELLLMIDAAKRASAYKVVVVVPYFGYARQDRKDKPRVSIGSKLMANMITAAGADRIITLDLHAPQIQGYFDIPVDHLDASALFIPYIQKLNLENLCFAAPDVGSANRIREIATYFNVDMVLCDKHRKRANEIASMVIIGDVKDKDIVLIDDIIDTGGTLSKSAALIKANGARSVRAFCTHPVLSGNAYDNIANSALEELLVSDTIPLKSSTPNLKVITSSDLFAIAIRHAYENKSIHELFPHSQAKVINK
jgi:ribose-phosphate pyrophosphokinase